MGEDKFVNEELIAFGWPEDIWYSVVSEVFPDLQVPR
jgi:hypothetical protein